MKEIIRNAKELLAAAALGVFKARHEKVSQSIIDSKNNLENATMVDAIKASNNNRTGVNKKQISDLQVIVKRYKGEDNKSTILPQISVFKQIGPNNSDSEIMTKFTGPELMEAEVKVEIHKAGVDLSGLWDLMKEAYDLYYAYLNSLTVVQSLAFSHLLVFLVIYFLFFNVFIILLGNWAIKYFKIEIRYPKLGK